MMPREEELKKNMMPESEPPNLERLLHENTSIIDECQGIGSEILLHLTTDDYKPTEEHSITCIMSELLGQNSDLRHLKETLDAIRAQMMGGNR